MIINCLCFTNRIEMFGSHLSRINREDCDQTYIESVALESLMGNSKRLSHTGERLPWITCGAVWCCKASSETISKVTLASNMLVCVNGHTYTRHTKRNSYMHLIHCLLQVHKYAASRWLGRLPVSFLWACGPCWWPTWCSKGCWGRRSSCLEGSVLRWHQPACIRVPSMSE